MITGTNRKQAIDFLTPEDRALLQRTFDIDDPSTLQRLLDDPPSTDEVPEIEFAYDMTPPGGQKKGHSPNLKCVFRHGPRHWKGLVIRWKNGARARIGTTCGAKHFGFMFREVRKRFGEARSRKGDLEKFIALRTLLPEVASELRGLQRHRSVVAFDEYRQGLRRDFPDLNHALGVIAQLDGFLRTTRQERDYDAEHDRAQRSEEGRKLFKDLEDAARKGPGVVRACNHRIKQWLNGLPPIMKTVTQEAGSLAGDRILTDPRLLQHIAASAAVVMSSLSHEVASNRSNHWNAAHPFSVTFKAIRDAIRLADSVTQLLKEMDRFGTPANLRRVSIWTEYEYRSPLPRVQHAVTSEGRALVCPATDAYLTFPEGFLLPTLPRLEELRRIVSAPMPAAL